MIRRPHISFYFPVVWRFFLEGAFPKLCLRGESNDSGIIMKFRGVGDKEKQ